MAKQCAPLRPRSPILSSQIVMNRASSSVSIARKHVIDPIAERTYAGVNAVFQSAGAAVTPRHNSHQHWTVGCPPHQRSATVPLAGIDAALSVPRAHHALLDAAVVSRRRIAGPWVGHRYDGPEQGT